jgi:hypothetical protein
LLLCRYITAATVARGPEQLQLWDQITSATGPIAPATMGPEAAATAGPTAPTTLRPEEAAAAGPTAPATMGA